MSRKHHLVGPTIVRAVMSRIERGSLRPGQRILPQELAQKLGISSTPVREALCQLVGREILIERPREGFYVASLTMATLRGLYAAHGRVMETIFRRWHAGSRLDRNLATHWRLFAMVAAGADDDALAGIERYLAGRLAVARSHEGVHIGPVRTGRDLIATLRADDSSTLLQINREFHQACENESTMIWQDMSE